jgi:hypothetical protein
MSTAPPLPTFEFVEEPWAAPTRRTAGPVAFLAATSVVLIWSGARLCRRVPITT